MPNSPVVLKMRHLAQLAMVFACLLTPVIHLDAAEFSCFSGNVTCLIAAINDANGLSGEHIITLDPGTYTLQVIDNSIDGQNGLPSITGSMHIQASGDDSPTVIERDMGAPSFRILHVSAGGDLFVDGITIQRGGPPAFGKGGPAIFNNGVTTLHDTIVTGNTGEEGAIDNRGTLSVLGSIITGNFLGHEGGGIVNRGGSVVVENSTIAENTAIGPGGIANFGGSLIIRNSALFQ